MKCSVVWACTVQGVVTLMDFKPKGVWPMVKMHRKTVRQSARECICKITVCKNNSLQGTPCSRLGCGMVKGQTAEKSFLSHSHSCDNRAYGCDPPLWHRSRLITTSTSQYTCRYPSLSRKTQDSIDIYSRKDICTMEIGEPISTIAEVPKSLHLTV